MNINSDINILGGLPDWNLITVFLSEDIKSIKTKGGIHSFTGVKTDKSVERFERAIKRTILKFKNTGLKQVFLTLIEGENLSSNTLLLLFWNASANNDLFKYLNETIFFPAFYGGRITVNKDEVEACINDLRSSENGLQKWTDETVKTVARKYLTLLKRFGLMDGSLNKSIQHPHLDDTMFVIYVYWLVAMNETNNLIDSNLLQYGFLERKLFIDRLLQKRFSKYFNIIYTGDRLKVETIIPYIEIYATAIKP